MSYTVTWTYTVDKDEAPSMEEAARYAREQQYPGTTASIFEVVDEDTGEETDVDLESNDPLVEKWKPL